MSSSSTATATTTSAYKTSTFKHESDFLSSSIRRKDFSPSVQKKGCETPSSVASLKLKLNSLTLSDGTHSPKLKMERKASIFVTPTKDGLTDSNRKELHFINGSSVKRNSSIKKYTSKPADLDTPSFNKFLKLNYPDDVTPVRKQSIPDEDLVKQLESMSIGIHRCTPNRKSRNGTPLKHLQHNQQTFRSPDSWRRQKQRTKLTSDRFIPDPISMNMDMSKFLISRSHTAPPSSSESLGAKDDDTASTACFTQSFESISDSSDPSSLNYQYEIAKACGIALDRRILTLNQHASKKDFHKPKLSRPLKPSSKSGVKRKIPTVPEKILDAPGISDDQDLNVLDWSPKNILAVGLGGSVYIWNGSTGTVDELCQLDEESENSVTSLSWSPDGSFISVGEMNGKSHLFDIETYTHVRTLQSNGLVGKVGSASWNSMNISLGCSNGTIHYHDVREARSFVSELHGHGINVSSLKWNSQGNLLASGGKDGLLNIWDARSTQARFTSRAHVDSVKVSWCPWQSNTLSSCGLNEDKSISFWNTSNNTLTSQLKTESEVSGILWSKNYKEFVSCHGFSDYGVTVWKYPTFKKIVELPLAHDGRILNMAMSPDGQVVCTGSIDENLKFWRLFANDVNLSKGKSGSSRSTESKDQSPDFDLMEKETMSSLVTKVTDNLKQIQGRRRGSSISGLEKEVRFTEEKNTESVKNSSDKINASTEKIIHKFLRQRSNSQPNRNDIAPIPDSVSGSNEKIKSNDRLTSSKTDLSKITAIIEENSATKRASKNIDADININFSKMSHGPTIRSTKPSETTTNTRELNLDYKSYHYYGVEEVSNYSEWINATLEPENDPELSYLFPDGNPLPVDGNEVDSKLFKAISDGVLLSKLIYATNSNAIDLNQVKKNPKNRAQILENNLLVINSAKKVGVKLNNVGPEDIYKGVPHLCLGLIGQIIKAGVLSKINLYYNPELRALLNDSEDASTITNEVLLMKWVNFHLTASHSSFRIGNFTSDLRNAEVLATLMKQLVSHGDSRSDYIKQLFNLMLTKKDETEKYKLILEMAQVLGCKRVLTIEDFIKGHKDHMLTFLGQLLAKFPNLEETLESHAQRTNKTNLEQFEQEKKHADQQIRQLKEQIQDLNGKIQLFQVQAEAHKAFESELLVRTVEAEKYKKNYEDTVEKLEVAEEKHNVISLQIKSMHTNTAAFQDIISKLQLELEHSRNENALLRNENETLKNECKKLNDHSKNIEKELEEKVEEVKESEQLAKKTKEQISELNSKIRILQLEADARTRFESELKIRTSEVIKYKKDCEEAQQKFEESEAKFNVINLQMKAMHSNTSAFQELIEKLQKEIDGYKKELLLAQNENESFKKECKSLLEQVFNLSKQNEVKVNESSELAKKLREAVVERTEFEHLKQLAKEKKQADSFIQEINAKLESFVKDPIISELNQAIAESERQLKNQIKKIGRPPSPGHIASMVKITGIDSQQIKPNLNSILSLFQSVSRQLISEKQEKSQLEKNYHKAKEAEIPELLKRIAELEKEMRRFKEIDIPALEIEISDLKTENTTKESTLIEYKRMSENLKREKIEHEKISLQERSELSSLQLNLETIHRELEVKTHECVQFAEVIKAIKFDIRSKAEEDRVSNKKSYENLSILKEKSKALKDSMGSSKMLKEKISRLETKSTSQQRMDLTRKIDKLLDSYL